MLMVINFVSLHCISSPEYIVFKVSFCDHWMSIGVATVLPAKSDTGMRKFRLDQDFLIEHWHMIYLMTVVFAEIYF